MIAVIWKSCGSCLCKPSCYSSNIEVIWRVIQPVMDSWRSCQSQRKLPPCTSCLKLYQSSVKFSKIFQQGTINFTAIEPSLQHAKDKLKWLSETGASVKRFEEHMGKDVFFYFSRSQMFWRWCLLHETASHWLHRSTYPKHLFKLQRLQSNTFSSPDIWLHSNPEQVWNGVWRSWERTC